MQKLKWFWNLLYYNIFRWLITAGNVFNFINPFYWFNKIPKVKNYDKENGIDDMNLFVDKTVFNDPKDGLNIFWASMHIGGILILLEFSILNFVEYFLNKSVIQIVSENLLNKIIFLFLLVLIPGVFNYFILYRKDAYLKYFKEFDNLTITKKRKYSIICLIFILSVISVLVFSIYLFIKIL